MPTKTWLIPAALLATLAASPAMATDRLAQTTPPQQGGSSSPTAPDRPVATPPMEGHGTSALPPRDQLPGTSGQPAQSLPSQPPGPPPQHPPSQQPRS